MAKGKSGSYRTPACAERGPMTKFHMEKAGHLHPKKGDSAPKSNPSPVKHHKPDNKEHTR